MPEARPPAKRGPAPIAIVALALLGLGSIFGGVMPHLDPLLISKPVQVTGRVVDLRAMPKGGLKPVVAFSAEGQRIRFEPKWSSSLSPLGIGDDVMVTYEAGAPARAAVALPYGIVDAALIIAGVVFCAIALALGVRARGRTKAQA